MLSEKSILV